MRQNTNQAGELNPVGLRISRRYGALLKLFRHRWGHVFPDDDAGRDDLFILVSVVSLAPAATARKMAHMIEMWAPWMTADEAKLLVDHVSRLTIYERMPAAKELGERVRLTNAERERLHLWPIAPIDMTDEQLAEQRKTKVRERKRKRRQDSGTPTRAAYLAKFESKQRPWEVEGIHRRTWERRRARAAVASAHDKASAALGDATIVIKAEDTAAAASKVETRKGHQERGEAKPRETGKIREVESQTHHQARLNCVNKSGTQTRTLLLSMT